MADVGLSANPTPQTQIALLGRIVHCTVTFAVGLDWSAALLLFLSCCPGNCNQAPAEAQKWHPAALPLRAACLPASVKRSIAYMVTILYRSRCYVVQSAQPTFCARPSFVGLDQERIQYCMHNDQRDRGEISGRSFHDSATCLPPPSGHYQRSP